MFIWFMNDAAYLVGSYEVKYAWNLYEDPLRIYLKI